MYQVAVCDDDINEGRHTLALAKQILLDRSIDASFSLFVSPRDLLEDIKKNSRKFDLLLLDILMERPMVFSLHRRCGLSCKRIFSHM